MVWRSWFEMCVVEKDYMCLMSSVVILLTLSPLFLLAFPEKNVDSSAIVLELKCDHGTDAAIDQIKRKQYSTKVAQYLANLLLVGINYDRQIKTHTCHIEKWRVECDEKNYG